MKLLIILVALLNLVQIPLIKSEIVRSSDYYETSIDGYKKNDIWPVPLYPISENLYASNTKQHDGKIFYSIKSIQDLDLNTAWVFNYDSVAKKSYFEYKFDFPVNTNYAGAYQFEGICYAFNGYCKSFKSWSENSRIKTMLVYYNDNPVCYVNLKDSWHLQKFDIAKFFKNRREKKYLHAKYEIKNGDRLRFEIIDIYRGTKFMDVALSESQCEGGLN